MRCICECSTIETVYKNSCSLVATLATTVNSTNCCAIVSIESVDSIDEVICCPCSCLEVDILVCTCSLECVKVDSHTMSCHNERILIELSVSCLASIESSRDKFFLICCIKKVRHIDHVALSSPVSNQSFRSFHDEVRSLSCRKSCVDFVVTVCISKVLDLYFDTCLCCEAFNEFLYCSIISPITDWICPKRDSLF